MDAREKPIFSVTELNTDDYTVIISGDTTLNIEKLDEVYCTV